jgi:hypothetical protein
MWVIILFALYSMVFSIVLNEIKYKYPKTANVLFEILPLLSIATVLLNYMGDAGFKIAAAILFGGGVIYGSFSYLFNRKAYLPNILLSAVLLLISSVLQVKYGDTVFSFGLNIHPIAHIIQAASIFAYGLGCSQRKS